MPPVRRYAGFGNEAVYGTAVAAQFHVDMQSATLDAPSGVENYYAGGLGRGIRTRRPGYYMPGGNIVYAWDIRTIAAMLRWTLGGYVFTDGGAGLNTHEAYGGDDVILPSFTARIGKDVFEHVFAGCVVDSLELDLAGDFLLATMVVGAKKDSKAALQDLDALLLPEEFPLAFHEATLQLPTATARSADVKTLKLSIANNQRGDSGRGIGSRYPYRMPVGNRDVTLAADLWYEDTDDLEDFWGGAAGPADAGPADQPVLINASAGADGALAIALPRVHFTKVALQPSGREEITASTELRALVDEITLADEVTVVNSEILTTVTNNADDLAA